MPCCLALWPERPFLFPTPLPMASRTGCSANRNRARRSKSDSDRCGKQTPHDVSRRVGITARRKKLRNGGDVVAGGEQGQFRAVAITLLAQTDAGGQPVAKTFAIAGSVRGSAL